MFIYGCVFNFYGRQGVRVQSRKRDLSVTIHHQFQNIYRSRTLKRLEWQLSSLACFKHSCWRSQFFFATFRGILVYADVPRRIMAATLHSLITGYKFHWQWNTIFRGYLTVDERARFELRCIPINSRNMVYQRTLSRVKAYWAIPAVISAMSWG